MSNLSEKELSAINDLLSEEELLVKKFKMLADHTDNQAVKKDMNNISMRHQEHFNKLYEHLK